MEHIAGLQIVFTDNRSTQPTFHISIGVHENEEYKNPSYAFQQEFLPYIFAAHAWEFCLLVEVTQYWKERKGKEKTLTSARRLDLGVVLQ